MNPKVSFVVPCYKLAHYLGECVESILSQTFTDFEILIMDDCSPDNTGGVAASFHDPRIRYVRNEPNLGHLRNYNKGIELSRGEYVWLISADDKLVRQDALTRYLQIMDTNVSAGFVCSAAVEIGAGNTTSVAKYSIQSTHDEVFPGHEFLKRLLYSNSVVAASGLVRRNCYDTFECFPLDLPFAGDWYLWCLFALHFDVAYCAEPLVGYRIHGESMTDALVSENVRICADDCLRVLWRIKRRAEEAGMPAMTRRCRAAIAYAYAQQLLGVRYRFRESVMDLFQCRGSIRLFADTREEQHLVITRMYVSAGDLCYQHGDYVRATYFYRNALRKSPWNPQLRVKLLLLGMGPLGVQLRTRIGSLQN